MLDRVLFATFSDKQEQSSSLFKIVLLSLLLYSIFVLSLCIVGSSLLLYPGINPIQSLFNIVFLSQFLYTLVLFFCYFFFFFYCSLSDPLCDFKVQPGPFFYIVFLFLLLCPDLIFPFPVLCRICYLQIHLPFSSLVPLFDFSFHCAL